MKFAIVSSYRLLLNSKEKFIYYKKGNIFVSNKITNKPEKLCKIPLSCFYRIFSKFSLTDRLFRIAPRCCEWIDKENLLLSGRGKIYRINIKEMKIICEHDLCSNMSAPLNFCKIDNLDGFDDGILYGEYVSTRSCQEVSIYQRKLDGKWHNVYSFKNSEILHIHNIVADYNKNRLLILTGDSDIESGIFEASENFKHVLPIIKGSQQYRACVAFTFENKIIYATDTPLENNHIYSYDENAKKVEKICDISGPCIFGTKYMKNGEVGFCFATSVEPDSKRKGIKYLLSYKLGSGVMDRYSHLIFLTNESKVMELGKFKKDIFPMGLLQFGNIYFIKGDVNSLYISPQCVQKFNNKTVKVLNDELPV